ncbi:MAG: hypothetical protein RLZZ70_486 [Candidatus Parcubacteria bacterium]|jgi:hypothetical protein
MEKKLAKVLSAEERTSAVAALLDLYQEYQRAWFLRTKKRIGNQMFFADPIIWIRYKHLAYQGTPNALMTWGDLVSHSFSHDGICGKRLDWLASEVAKEGIDVFSQDVVPIDAMLSEVATLPIFQKVANNPKAMQVWASHEYYEERGQPKKWAQYTIMQIICIN